MAEDQRTKASLQDVLAFAGRASSRKLDLFNVWCCQALRPYLTDRRSIAAARYAKRHADEGWTATAERSHILHAARDAVHELAKWAHDGPTSAEVRRRRVYAHAAQVAAQAVGNSLPNRGAYSSANLTAYAFGWANDDATGPDGDSHRADLRAAHLQLQSAVLRDLLVNRTVFFDPRWRTADVVGVARAIYDDAAFVRMPILADALMDAGCDDGIILAHCRGDGPHVRGCWLVDVVLGQE